MLFTVLLISAAYIDYKIRQIPNIITITIIIMSVVCGTAPVIARIAGLLIPAVPLLIIALKNNEIKGGDIKFLSAVGAYMGLYELAKVLVPVTITAVVWGYAYKTESVPLATVFFMGYSVYYVVIIIIGGMI